MTRFPPVAIPPESLRLSKAEIAGFPLRGVLRKCRREGKTDREIAVWLYSEHGVVVLESTVKRWCRVVKA